MGRGNYFNDFGLGDSVEFAIVDENIDNERKCFTSFIESLHKIKKNIEIEGDKTSILVDNANNVEVFNPSSFEKEFSFLLDFGPFNIGISNDRNVVGINHKNIYSEDGEAYTFEYFTQDDDSFDTDCKMIYYFGMSYDDYIDLVGNGLDKMKKIVIGKLQDFGFKVIEPIDAWTSAEVSKIKDKENQNNFKDLKNWFKEYNSVVINAENISSNFNYIDGFIKKSCFFDCYYNPPVLKDSVINKGEIRRVFDNELLFTDIDSLLEDKNDKEIQKYLHEQNIIPSKSSLLSLYVAEIVQKEINEKKHDGSMYCEIEDLIKNRIKEVFVPETNHSMSVHL